MMAFAGYACAAVGLLGFLYFVLMLRISPALTLWVRKHEGVPPRRLGFAARTGLSIYAFAARYWCIGMPFSLVTSAVGALLLLISAQPPE